MTGALSPPSPGTDGRRLRGRILVALLVAAGCLLLVVANAHLVYVAVTSQPDCVSHIKQGESPAGPDAYHASGSAC
jgi:hypothetical protein